MKMLPTSALVLLLASLQGGTAQPSRELLTNAVDILSLPTEQATTEMEVSLRGIVTAAQPGWDGKFFVQDDTAGIFVVSVSNQQPTPGDVVTVSGVTHPGGFAPIIDQARWEKVGTAPLPVAKRVSIEQLMAGVEDSLRVEIAGVVRAAQTEEESVIFDIVSGGYRLRAFTPLSATGDPQLLVGTQVRVRGTAAASFHPELRHLVAVTLYIPLASDLSIERSQPGDPFTEPVSPLNRIAQYRRDLSPGKRIHVRGTVVHQRLGKDVFLQDGTGGLQIQTRQLETVLPGEMIEAIGFPDFDQLLPVLRDAVFRKTGAARENLVANAATLQELERGLHHAQLITLQGTLLNRAMRQTDPSTRELHPGHVVLTIQTSNVLFTAEGPVTESTAGLATIPLGSIVEVTGICMLHIRRGGTLESGDVGTMESFQLLLPGMNSIRLVQKPSWLTPRRLLAGLALLSGVLILAVIWSVTVSRKNAALKVVVYEKAKAQDELQKAHDELDDRVKERTAQLKFEMDARNESEVRFKATLAERTRLAQELHDGLEQSLTGIGLQLDAAATLFEQRADGANRPLTMARNLMSRSQLELRRSIWDLRSRELEEFDLPNALRVSGREILEGTNVELEFTSTGQPHPLSEILEENLLRIGREALTNIIKHAGATRVTVSLAFKNEGVGLKITDNGRGFEPGTCPGSNEGHFGLSGMSERATRIGGRLQVTSSPGTGTCIELDIPSQQPDAVNSIDNPRGLT